MLYIITKTVNGITYYLGDRGWEGLIDNAAKLSKSTSTKIVNKHYSKNPYVTVIQYQQPNLN